MAKGARKGMAHRGDTQGVGGIVGDKLDIEVNGRDVGLLCSSSYFSSEGGTDTT